MGEKYKIIIDHNAMLEKLNMLSNISGLRINFYPDGGEGWISTTAIPKSKFCSIVKSCKKGRACCNSSNERSVEAAKSIGKPIFRHCHFGLSEGIVPLYYNDQYVGSFMFGQVLSHHPVEEDWNKVYAIAKNWDVPLEELKKAYFGLPYVSKDKIEDLGELLLILASHTYDMEILRLVHQDLISVTESYILQNYNKNILLKEIADYVHLNASYLSMVFKKVKGVTITEYLTRLRIEKAKEMLLTTHLSIIEISEKTGYLDQNYFTKVFKKATGITPSYYRRTAQNS